ncbi:TPA: hypothetical protein U1366_001819 [Streptococcus suis]|nr:hypothetical protein [Streptococcus suis]
MAYQIYFDSVSVRTPYTLEIKCFIRMFDINHRYTIIYSGADASSPDATLTDRGLQEIKMKLNKLLGFGPFELENVENIINNKKSISFNN